MAKTKAPIAAEVLLAAETDLANDESRLVEIARERGALDPLAGDFLSRAEDLDRELRTIEARASTLRARQSDVARAASLERAAAHEQALLSARADVQRAFESAIGYILGQRPLLMTYQEALIRLDGLGGYPWPGQIIPGLYVSGVEALLTTLRTSSPELLGLPRRPSKLDEQRADAISQAQHVVDLWSQADAAGRDGGSDRQRAWFRRRAEELVPLVALEEARCREVGAVPPASPQSLMGQLLNFVDRQTRELAQEARDREEAALLAQATPDTPGSGAILANRQDRNTP